MRRRGSRWAVLAIAAGAALAACSSPGGSSAGSAGGSGSSGSKVIKFGVMYDVTGPASSGEATLLKGVDAYMERVNADGGVDGYKLQYVVADTTSTPTGALTAAQKLVQQDGVSAIVENSAVFYGAEPYLLQAGIPVVGSALDSTIWANPKYTNLFAATGVIDERYMEVPLGQFMKSQGVTKCGAVAYSGSVSSALSATGTVRACQHVGLQAGYVNTQVPFGSTNVGPIALAIKNSGVNGLYLPVVPSTALALVTALHQLGVNLKAALLPDAYGGDLLASKLGVELAQGMDFLSFGVPAEVHTPAAKQRAADLAKVGVTGVPTVAEQLGYLNMSAFVTGLKAAGPGASRAPFIKAMSQLGGFDGDGLLPYQVNFRNHDPSSVCLWIAQLNGNGFRVPAGEPVCGPLVKFTNQAAG
jgi:branched-chain amino acid transport system substrate-binding protein